MKALLFERSIPRYARGASRRRRIASGRGANVGPLRLTDVDEPELPNDEWHRVRPRLAGICGSDLATVDGKASRYFEPIVSFPFVPGHEIVGELDDDARIVVEPVLKCAARGVTPKCDACTRGATNLCERTAFGHIEPGLQTGYCSDTGGGWSQVFVAHESQIHRVPDGMSDEAAVMVEPTACAVHAARRPSPVTVSPSSAPARSACSPSPPSAMACKCRARSSPRPSTRISARWPASSAPTWWSSPTPSNGPFAASTRSLRIEGRLTSGAVVRRRLRGHRRLAPPGAPSRRPRRHDRPRRDARRRSAST